MKLPPLPVPDGTLYGPDRGIKGHSYLAATMRQYAMHAVAELEAELGRVTAERDEALEDACAVVKSLQEANAERDAAVRDAEALRMVFRSVVQKNISFSWNGTKQCHVPWIMVEFAEVSSGEPNTAKGWRDRDVFAAAIDAARKEGA